MTEEQIKIIRNFEVRVRQTLFLCDKLKEENANLLSQLAVQKNTNELLNEENSQLKSKYGNQQVAKVISVSRNDFKATKIRLSNLVREVNKCIALLNE